MFKVNKNSRTTPITSCVSIVDVEQVNVSWIGISAHKTSQNSNKINFNLPGYTFLQVIYFVLMTESCRVGTGFFISNNLNVKLNFNLNFIILFRHPGMKISHFNGNFLTPPLDKILKEY